MQEKESVGNLMAFGNFHFYSSLAPATDAGFGYPIVQAPADKAITITQLSYYTVTNTANTEIIYYIVPSGSQPLADGSYEIADITAFSLGFLSVSIIPSSIIGQVSAVGLPSKGAFTTIVIPAGAILVGAPSATANLNGTVQHRAIGYECAIGDY